jgi:hypothetical protein
MGLRDLIRLHAQWENTTALVRGFGQYELVVEAEERHTLSVFAVCLHTHF